MRASINLGLWQKDPDLLVEAPELAAELVILRVHRVEFDAVDEFCDPPAIARAAEGFCPFPTHHYHPDSSATEQPIRLIRQPDGSLLCPFQARPEDEGTLMKFEWIRK